MQATCASARKIAFIALLSVLLCPIAPAAAEQPSAKPTGTPAGSMAGKDAVGVYAVYVMGTPAADLLAKSEAALKAQLSGWEQKKASSGASPSYSVVHLDDAHDEYTPPPPEVLEYSGRGLSATEVTNLQAAQHAVVAIFAYPASCVPKCVEESQRAMAAVQQATTGLLWDETTREVFTAESWRTMRIDSWSSGIPDMREHITIHSYQSGPAIRAVTLGMSKFALPDLVVPAFAWSSGKSVGSLINLTAQTLVQGVAVTDGSLPLDLNANSHPVFKKSLLASTLPNAVKTGSIKVAWTPREAGDNDNRLLAISLGGTPEAQVEALTKFLASIFGSSDSPVAVTNSPKLAAAKQRAIAKLPELKAAFNAGYPPGQYLMLKAAFKTPDARTEYMWVEVSTWTDSVKGILQNDPLAIPTLAAGQTVIVQESDVIDYIINLPNGERLGYETEKALEQ